MKIAKKTIEDIVNEILSLLDHFEEKIEKIFLKKYFLTSLRWKLAHLGAKC